MVFRCGDPMEMADETKVDSPKGTSEPGAVRTLKLLASFVSRANLLRLLPYGVLAALVVIPYINVIRAPFIWDDSGLVEENAHIRSMRDIPYLFSLSYWRQEHPGTHGQYRPLRTTSFAINYALFGPDPKGFHLVNIALYVVVVWLVYALALRILRDRFLALVAAALFAVHPAHTEAVAWIKNRSEIMATLFVLVGFLGFMAGQRGRPLGYLLSVSAFPPAVLSKEVAVVYPILLIAWLIHFRREVPLMRRVLPVAPHMILLAAYGVFLFLILPLGMEGGKAAMSLTLPKRAVLVFHTLGIYVKDIFLPISLNAEHVVDLKETPWTALESMGVAAMFLSLALWAWLFLKGDSPKGFSLGWMALALLPALNLVYIPGRSIADQRVFLASVGGCLLAGALFGDLTATLSRGAGLKWVLGLGARVGLVLLLIAAGYATHRRNWVWTDPVLLYQDTVRKSPQSYRAHYNFGVSLFEKGRFEEALAHFQEAVRLNPKSPEAHNNLAVALYNLGEKEEALSHYRIALRFRPHYAEAHANLGVALAKAGNPEQGKRHIELALSMKPKSAKIHFIAGVFHEDRKDYAEAFRHYRRAVELRRSYPRAIFRLGNVSVAMGKYQEAVHWYQEALRLRPNYAGAHNNLGVVLEKLGRVDEALSHFRRALEIKEDFPQAYKNLGMLLAKQERVDEAIANLKMALQHDPNYTEARLRLGLLLAQKGLPQEALVHLQRVLKERPDDLEALSAIGRCMADQGRQQQAVEAFTRVLALEPKNARALNEMGVALSRLGRGQQAVEYFSRCLELSPEDPLVLTNLGMELVKLGRPEEAIPHLKKALKFKPDYGVAHHYLGLAFAAVGRPSKAVFHYRKALELQPHSAQIHNNLGAALGRMGKTQEALLHYRKAMEIDPDYEEARLNLGVALTRLGRVREAIEEFLRVTRSDPLSARGRFYLGVAYLMDGKREMAAREVEALRGLDGDLAGRLQAMMERGTSAEHVSPPGTGPP